MELQGWSSEDGIPGMDGKEKTAGMQRQGWTGRNEGTGMKLRGWSSSSGAGVGMAGMELQGCSYILSCPAAHPNWIWELPAVGDPQPRQGWVHTQSSLGSAPNPDLIPPNSRREPVFRPGSLSPPPSLQV